VNKKSIDDVLINDLEQKLIKEAYGATLDPTRLANFEKYWGAYIDSKIADGPESFDIDDPPVDAHVLTALDILERIRNVNEIEQSAQILVDSHYGFGFIIDHHGDILVTNSSAVDFIGMSNTLTDLNIDELSKKQLMRWVKDVREKDAEPYSFFHLCINGSAKLHCWFVCPITVDPANKNNCPDHFLITSVENEICGRDGDVIGKSLGLSPAETSVAKMLSIGRTPKEIAKARGVKITAVRTQIAKIKNKTGCQDIPAIVVKFTSMSLRSSAVKSQIGRMNHVRGHDQEKRMILKDGRQYQYYLQGHPKGKAIVQIHSLISSVEITRQSNQHLVMSGYKMISPVRSGYGKSDLKTYANINDRVDGCVSDLIELLDHLKIDEYTIVTAWAGAIAQRLALKDRSRVKGIFLSGAVPLWDQSHFMYLSPRYQNIIKTSMYAPRIVPYMIRLAKVLVDSGRTKQFFGDLYDMNDSDRQALQNKEIYDIVERRFKFWVEQGVQAFVSDIPSIYTNWEEDAKKLKTPVSVLMGTEIKDQPPEAIARYLNLVPHAKRIDLQGAGTYQDISHFPQILSEIIAAS